MSCIVTAEGFFVSRDYVIKELTLLFSLSDFQHFMFDPPVNIIIAPSDRATIRYTERLNGLRLTDSSFLPYEVIGYILEKVAHLKIYTAGQQVTDALKRYLPRTQIIDVCKDYGFRYPLDMMRMNCFKSHPARYCSYSKAVALKHALHV